LRAILQELVYDSPVGGAVWPFDRAYIRPPHFHGQVEVLLIRGGTATLHLGARQQQVRAGQLCWILPCVPHVMSAFSSDFDMWVIEVEAALMGSCWGSTVRRDADPDAAPTARTAFAAVASLGERLAGRTMTDIGAEDARRIDGLARRIWNADAADGVKDTLQDLCCAALRATLPNVDDRVEASLTDLASCLLLGSPLLDRRAMAADLGVSEGFLSRCFGRELGVSFVEHRARSRLAHFLALVQGGNRNLLDASLAAGFGSYSQFHRVFTRISGTGPRDYFTRGRHRLQRLIAGDVDQPHVSPMRLLSRERRHRARLDGQASAARARRPCADAD